VKPQSLKTLILLLVLLTFTAIIGWLVLEKLGDSTDGKKHKGDDRPIPVETGSIERGAIELRRTFTGTLEASASFIVAPKISGRIEELNVDLADEVEWNQVVARLDNAEYVQAVTQAEADVAVAKANLKEAESLLQIAQRELDRIERLSKRGVSSESQRDTVMSDLLAREAHVQVTKAQLTRAEAELQSTVIRRGYTVITAGWSGKNGEKRVIAERFVDEGETVSANAPLLEIVDLDPITAVFYVTERDYALLKQGQTVALKTDVYPDESFTGSVKRIAPVFRENTRQARVELGVDNSDQRLKPGMFVRATVVLERVEDAISIPAEALTRRKESEGVFLVSEDGKTVQWQAITPGIKQGERLEILDTGLSGKVVTLGQQLLDDGSSILLPAAKASKKTEKKQP
jgi:RND family efflux transporter MFP subunit